MNASASAADHRSSPQSKGGYRISPAKKSVYEILKELWDFRSVIAILVQRDVKVRYKQTYIGLAWYVIQPLAYMAVFSIVFNFMFRAADSAVPQSMYLLSGVVFWSFFSRGVNTGAIGFHNYMNVIGKVYFPRLAAPLCYVLSAFLDFLIGAVLLALGMILTQTPIGPRILLAPLALAALFATCCGTALLFASLDVRLRDVRHSLNFIMQLWMFSTPIMYPLGVIPQPYRDLLAVNPLVGWLEAFRWSLFAAAPAPRGIDLVGALVTSSLIIWLAVLSYRRAEPILVDTL